MNKRHYEHTLPNIRGSLSNTYDYWNLYFIIRKKGREHSKYLFLFQQSNHFYSKSFKNSSNASLNASGCSIFIM